MSEWQGYGEPGWPGRPEGGGPGDQPSEQRPGPPGTGQPPGAPYSGAADRPVTGHGTPGYPQPGHPAAGYPPGYGPGYGYNYPYGPPPVRGTNTMAILALVMAFVLAPLGLIFGIVARRQIRETGEDGDGLALAGVVIGATLTALYIIGIVIAVVALVAVGTVPR